MLLYIDSTSNFFPKNIEAIEAIEYQFRRDGRCVVGIMFERQFD
jgi:hypothetical protein